MEGDRRAPEACSWMPHTGAQCSKHHRERPRGSLTSDHTGLRVSCVCGAGEE